MSHMVLGSSSTLNVLHTKENHYIVIVSLSAMAESYVAQPEDKNSTLHVSEHWMEAYRL